MTLKNHRKQTTYIVHRSLINQLKHQYQNTASSKTRSEVRGGGRKPWKQKGTGKARAGSIRSPLWRGGGVTFGPKPIQSLHKINIKEKRLALSTLLHNKNLSISIIPDNNFNIDYPKTQLLYKQLQLMEVKNDNKILIIVNQKYKNLYLASRNLKNIDIIQADHLNIISVLNAEKILITENGLLTIQKIYHA
jgi:large subunit ribosomal protein L4